MNYKQMREFNFFLSYFPGGYIIPSTSTLRSLLNEQATLSEQGGIFLKNS